MCQYLNSNAGGIQAVSSILALLTTVVLAKITWKYVKLTKRLAETSETQLRFQKESEMASIQQDIIDRSLQFIFRINDDINSLHASKSSYLHAKTTFPDKQKEIESLNKDFLKDLLRIADKKMFAEIMFVSFQLKRLQDNNLWKDFEQIGNVLEKIFNALSFSDNMDEYEATEAVFKKHVKEFVDKCIDISRIGKFQPSR